jgi:hypothetical protein
MAHGPEHTHYSFIAVRDDVRQSETKFNGAQSARTPLMPVGRVLRGQR